MKVVWHDHGCIVFAPCGRRLPFTGRRYTPAEIAGKSKAEIARLPGAIWKRFSF